MTSLPDNDYQSTMLTTVKLIESLNAAADYYVVYTKAMQLKWLLSIPDINWVKYTFFYLCLQSVFDISKLGSILNMDDVAYKANLLFMLELV